MPPVTCGLAHCGFCQESLPRETMPHNHKNSCDLLSAFFPSFLCSGHALWNGHLHTFRFDQCNFYHTTVVYHKLRHRCISRKAKGAFFGILVLLLSPQLCEGKVGRACRGRRTPLQRRACSQPSWGYAKPYVYRERLTTRARFFWVKSLVSVFMRCVHFCNRLSATAVITVGG